MDSAKEKDGTQVQNNNFGTQSFKAFIFIKHTTWLKTLLVNMSKLALMFYGKFHCIETATVRKKNIVQTQACDC